MNDVAVIVVHYKNSEDTKETLTNLVRSNGQFQIIVVANSGEQNEAFLPSNNSNIDVLRPGKNTGFSKGNNLGIAKALDMGVKSVILLNNDTVFSPFLIQKLCSFAQKNPEVGIISPKIYFEKGYEYHKNRYKPEEKGSVLWYAGGIIDWNNMYVSHKGVDEVDRGQYDRVCETEFATGCCMLIKRDVIEKIGTFDEEYFLYFEDVDYSQRAQKAGFRVLYYPGLSLSHKNASSSGKPGSVVHRYYLTRNRLYFAKKYARKGLWKSLVLQSIQQVIHGGIESQAILDFFLGRMGGKTI